MTICIGRLILECFFDIISSPHTIDVVKTAACKGATKVRLYGHRQLWRKGQELIVFLFIK